MARNNTEVAEGTTEAPATETAAAATPERTNLIQINVPEGHVVTQLAEGALAAGQHPRNAVIRALAATGEWTRGAIAKEISALQGKKVTYQIVFQATKNIPNVKLVERESASAGTAEVPAGEATEVAE